MGKGEVGVGLAVASAARSQPPCWGPLICAGKITDADVRRPMGTLHPDCGRRAPSVPPEAAWLQLDAVVALLLLHPQQPGFSGLGCLIHKQFCECFLVEKSGILS